MTILGEGFRPRTPEADRPALNPMDEVLIAISLLRESLMSLPAPVVRVEPQDLSAVVQAVQGLAGPTSQLTAQDIADAVREVLLPAPVVESTPEWTERLLEALEKIDFRMKSTGVVSGGGSSSVTVQNQPGTSLSVAQKQILDTANTTTYTNSASQYIGGWTSTREVGVQRCLVILASDVTSGLGGTFVFEFSEDGSTATVTETRPIDDFATVRDFDLENVGAYFRVKFTPSRTVTASEHVYITTQYATQYPGSFVRLANQELEEQNAALPSTFAYVKAFDPVTGKSTNVRSNRLGDLNVVDQSLGITESGSLFVESIRDDIRISFSRSDGAASVSTKIQAVTTQVGTATHDSAQGQVVFATGSGAGRVCYYESVKTAVYEPGHTIRGEQTIQISALPTGTQTIEWGYGEDDGAGNVLNGVGYGIDATGLYTWRRKAGVLVTQTRQTSFYDKLDGGSASRFRIMGTPVAFQPLENSLFRTDYEWLGVAPPQYLMMTPEGDFITVNIEATVNQMTGTTVPDPALSLFVRIYNGAGGDLQVRSGSWRGGINTSKVVQTGLNPDQNYADSRVGGPLTNSPATSLLGSSGAYTSAWYSSTGYVSIEAMFMADQVSATNGIEFQFSDDGSTIRRRTFRTYNAADVTNGSKFIALANQANYFRLVYTNGGVAQGTFFVGLRLNTTQIQQAVDGIEAELTGTSSATMVRNIIAAKSDAGVYGNITRSTTAGALRVSIAESETTVKVKPDTGITGSAGTVTTAASKVIDITTIPTGATAVQIQAQKGNNQLIFGATSAANATSSNAYFEIDAGQAQMITIGTGLTTDIYLASATGTQGYRILWTFGGAS